MPSATFTQLPPERREHVEEIVDFQKMNQLRARVDEIVRDRATAEALKPWYRYMCKRPTFSDTYLETFNRPNVTLGRHRGPRRRAKRHPQRGRVGEDEYEVDCIIFATGFDVGISGVLYDRLSVHSRGGVTLAQYWYGEGPLAFHALLHQWRLTGIDDVLVDATQLTEQPPRPVFRPPVQTGNVTLSSVIKAAINPRELGRPARRPLRLRDCHDPGEGHESIPPARGVHMTTRFSVADYALRDSTAAGCCDCRCPQTEGSGMNRSRPVTFLSTDSQELLNGSRGFRWRGGAPGRMAGR
jgi:hypothetical protein